MSTIKTLVNNINGVAQYDESAKALLARKPFLANILVRTVKEYMGMDPKYVETLIEGTPNISSIPVEEGLTNKKYTSGTSVIIGMNNESRIPNEGVLYYDVIFYIRSPKGREKIIINVEAQKEYPTKYHVENRGIFYCARSISAQLGREFKNQKYNKMQKVYSIWICMNCTNNQAYHIHLKKDDLIGNKKISYDYDLINVIIIELESKLTACTDMELHRLLGAMFLAMDKEEKINIFENEFGIDVDSEEKEIIAAMCNLGEGVMEQGLAQGRDNLLREQINKKLSKGKSLEIIAEELEEDVEVIKKLLSTIEV